MLDSQNQNLEEFAEEVSDNVNDGLVRPLLNAYDEVDRHWFKNFLSRNELTNATTGLATHEQRVAATVAREHLNELQRLRSDELLPDRQGITRADLNALGALADQFKTEIVLAGRIRDYVLANFDRFNENEDQVVSERELIEASVAPENQQLHELMLARIRRIGHVTDTTIVPTVTRLPSGNGSILVHNNIPVSHYGVSRQDLVSFPKRIAEDSRYNTLLDVNESITK